MDAIKFVTRWAIIGLLLLGAAYAIEFRDVGATSAAVTWNDVIAWAYADAAEAGISGAWIERVLWCESRGNPYAHGRLGEVGPGQFLPVGGIWWDLPESRMVPLDYSWWSLRLQVQAMVGAFARGLSWHWSCK